MLVALDQGGQVINLLCLKTSQIAELKTQHLVFPACRQRVYLKHGQVRMPHFAHVRLLSCAYNSENESFQHLSLKKDLFYWFAKTAQVSVEQFLPELQQIPDLLVNDKLAVEVQCSMLSVAKLQERTKGYLSKDYQVIWLTGKKLWLGHRLTVLKQQFLNFSLHVGFYYWEIDDQKKELRLNYLIHEDITGSLHYLVQHFAFGSGELLTILRQPFLKTGSELRVQPKHDIANYIRRQLHYKHPKWLKIQELYYHHGQHILADKQDMNQVCPVGLNYLTYQFEGIKVPEFCQVTKPIKSYYHQFIDYQHTHRDAPLYSPLVYATFFDGNLKRI